MAKCEKCHGSGYVTAPPDNAWRLHFARHGYPNQNVLVDCPVCKPDLRKSDKR